MKEIGGSPVARVARWSARSDVKPTLVPILCDQRKALKHNVLTDSDGPWQYDGFTCYNDISLGDNGESLEPLAVDRRRAFDVLVAGLGCARCL